MHLLALMRGVLLIPRRASVYRPLSCQIRRHARLQERLTAFYMMLSHSRLPEAYGYCPTSQADLQYFEFLRGRPTDDIFQYREVMLGNFQQLRLEAPKFV